MKRRGWVGFEENICDSVERLKVFEIEHFAAPPCTSSKYAAPQLAAQQATRPLSLCFSLRHCYPQAAANTHAQSELNSGKRILGT